MEQSSVIAEQMRKARWYAYMRRRFNLVSFEDIADWCARDAEGVGRNEAMREQALHDLENSVALGEFGAADRRLIPCFPKPPPVGEPRHAVKLSAGQIRWMRDSGHSVTRYLHITADQAQAWLAARGIPAPPWLSSRLPGAGAEGREPSRKPEATSNRPEARPPFDRREARALLVSKKINGGSWVNRPGYKEAQAFLLQNYATAPRDVVYALMREVWGDGKRGPRTGK